MNKPVIIIGAGGHAKVLIDTLKLSGVEIIGILDALPETKGLSVFGVEVLGNDERLSAFDTGSIELVNAVGSVSQPVVRKQVFDMSKIRGFRFATVIHPSAVISPHTELAEGVQIMAGAVVQPGCRVGCNVIINTRASVDHDCVIEDHVHIAPGVTLSGGVVVGECTHIGTGATVIQGVTIGKECHIAAGAVVIRNTNEGDVVMGIPAKVQK